MRREFTYPSTDGIHQIHAAEWLPEGEIRAVVQIVHGVAEYILRYDPLAQFLAGHGFLVCGEDHLGHGLTAKAGEFGYFGPKNGWDLVTRDVRRLRKMEGEQHPDLPYIMLGHSMGSFLTRTYLIRWPGTVDGAVLSGTRAGGGAPGGPGQGPVGHDRVPAGPGLCERSGVRHVHGLLQQALPPQPDDRRLAQPGHGAGEGLPQRPPCAPSIPR